MLLYICSRIVSAAGAFVYPTYASYKTLSRRPASEQDLERWLMYWSVLGTLLAVEYTAGWAISWIPFYHLIKTLFLLYLALPHTRGATYIYTAHLRPQLAMHEANIDATLLRARAAGLRWIQHRIRAAWSALASVSVLPQPEPQPVHAEPEPETGSILPSLWQTYATLFAALMQPPARAPPSSPPPPSPPSPQTSPDTTQALLARRRALEAELASLPLPSPSPPTESPTAILPRMGSSTYLGERYEEVVPEEGPGPEPNRGSWWWGRADGYERLKTE